MTIKSINGLASASIKSVNGLAKASVKNWNGLAFPTSGFTPNANTKLWMRYEDNVLDSSGNGNNGTNTNGTFVTGQVGKAISLNGTAYVQVADTSDIRYAGGLITISFWYKPTNTTGVQTVISKWANGGTDDPSAYDYIVYQNGGTINAFVNGSAGLGIVSGAISAGNWYHIVFTADSSYNMTLYINSVNVSQATRSLSTPATTHTPVRVGQNTGVNFFNGLVDELIIENVVRNSTEVANMFNTGNW